MTTDTLNKSNLIPNKDYNKEKLLTGMLQLPDCFHLIIDETQLSSGSLDQKGQPLLLFFHFKFYIEFIKK